MTLRLGGLEKVFLDGSETLSSSKFSLIFGTLKQRIADEQHTYTRLELKLAHDLVQLADTLEILYRSQDTPLYSTQTSVEVNQLAQDLVFNVQKPFSFEWMPPAERETYVNLYNEVASKIEQRNNLLGDYTTIEKFCRIIDSSFQYDCTCLLGLSQSVVQLLDQLSKFNRIIVERFNLMTTNVSGNNNDVYMVNYVLSYIGRLELVHQSLFPQESRLRRGNYETIIPYESNAVEIV